MHCQNCGKENAESSKFCISCGNKIQAKEEINTSLFTIDNNKDLKEETIIKENNKKENKTSSVIIGVAILIIIFVMVYLKIQDYFQHKKEINSVITKQQEEKDNLIKQLQEDKDNLIKKQQEELRIKSEEEKEVLKKEIESLKTKSDNQAKNQKLTDTKLAELKEELESSKVSQSNYNEQSSAVIGAIAKVYCDLDNNKSTTGSGSVWSYNDNYYLVTNYHVLEDANGINEFCAITLVQDWNAVTEDFDKAYQDDNLLIYAVDTSAYTYWEDLDLAISKLIVYEQPLSYLEYIAMVTNENECNENFSADTKLKIIGYPYTSAFTLPTITEGIISSWEDIGNAGYYITSAKIEHGNSGGIAVTENYYCMVGIPSAVVVGSSESLGRILVLNELDLKYLFENLIE